MKLLNTIAAYAVVGGSLITTRPGNARDSMNCTSYASLGISSYFDSHGGTLNRTDSGNPRIWNGTYTSVYGGGSSFNYSTTS